MQCLQAWPAQGRALHVKQDGSGDAVSVQGGIDLASSGDTVWVHPGRYLENVRFNGRSICLMSVAGPDATILDGSGREESVVRMMDGEGPATLLQGFTITGGGGDHILGAGIHLMGAEPTIRGNIIRDNVADSGGGGLFCTGASISGKWSPLIEGNRFANNAAHTLGGGIEVHGNATPIIVRNTIVENEVTQGDGGGISVFARLDGIVIRENWIEGNVAGDGGGGVAVIGEGLDTEIAYNVIVRNTAHGTPWVSLSSGGGIALSGTDAWVHHNTVVGNTGFGGTGDWGGGVEVLGGSPVIEMNIIAHSVLGGGILCGRGSVPTIRNNLAWDNVGGEGWRDCEDWWQSDGNLIADPLLCDWESGVYTVAANSPALTHPAGPLGAFATPGCAKVSVVTTTWGWIKSNYKR